MICYIERIIISKSCSKFEIMDIYHLLHDVVPYITLSASKQKKYLTKAMKQHSEVSQRRSLMHEFTSLHCKHFVLRVFYLLLRCSEWKHDWTKEKQNSIPSKRFIKLRQAILSEERTILEVQALTYDFFSADSSKLEDFPSLLTLSLSKLEFKRKPKSFPCFAVQMS